MKSKVLLAHNHYRSGTPSGEAHVFEIESEMLSLKGHLITTFERHSDSLLKLGHLGKIVGALSTPWNPKSAWELSKQIKNFKPDVVHVHNTFPLISPSVFSSVGKKAATVLTLHNYRLFCPKAIPMRDGEVCTLCIDTHSIRASIKYGCYKNSRISTVPVALNVALHRKIGTWSHYVDAFIALTEFQRELMIKGGLPAELIHVKPNFFPGNPTIKDWESRTPCVVFAGRLSAEKGIKTLIQAWLKWGDSAPELKVIGDGELKEPMMRLAKRCPDVPIRFLGQLNAEDAQQEIANARMLILPSEWFEGFPMVIREAFAFGTPVAVSDIGPLSSIVKEGVNGVLFSPGNAASLLENVKRVWASQDGLMKLSRGARQSFDDYYTEDINYKRLMKIYESAIEVNEQRKKGKRET